ncbi:MAG: hypothetical protein A2Z29_07990 [Chloroflexi bacterium RBG_16_56_11]|nr:MAG: hypothetical protein A2Z29_07990 [Chloroflexi bacterium RBG_16_56_11]
MISDLEPSLEIVRNVLSADFSCEEADLEGEGVFIRLARQSAGARRFPRPAKFLAVVTMGKGVVACCSANRLRWARANLAGLSRDDIFSATTITRLERYVAHDRQSMAGPDLKYICTPASFRPYAANGKIELVLTEGENIPVVYTSRQFPNALGYTPNAQRPRVVTCKASYGGVVAGLAAASADGDVMWQIGVDILPEYRERGIGKTLVSAVTAAILNKGILPYYSTVAPNIASRRTALSLGYFPAWVELYSRDIQT